MLIGNTESPLVANSVDGILGTPGNFVVVGSIALADNTNYDLNNVALCNIDNYCTPVRNKQRCIFLIGRWVRGCPIMKRLWE